MNIAIDKKVFIVTGASSGIGEEICKQLSKKGAFVVCAARRKDELDRVSDIINKSGGLHKYMNWDGVPQEVNSFPGVFGANRVQK